MGTRNPDRKFKYDDDLSFLSDLDVHAFEDDHYQKASRRAKSIAHQRRRKRKAFSHSKSERRVTNRHGDWDNFRPDLDDDLYS